MKIHTCRKCGADVEMWLKPGTNWQCQCCAWNIFNPRNVDEKTVAERKWQAPLKPKAEQQACDAGLFSDDSKQTELKL